jgi:hypothetical protein
VNRNSTLPGPQVVLHTETTTAGLNAIYEGFIEEVRAARSDKFAISYVVDGTLGAIEPAWKGWHFEVPLHGADNTAIRISCKEQLIAGRFRSGDLVRVRGRIRTWLKGGWLLQIRFEAFDIEPAEANDLREQRRQDLLTLDELKRLTRRRVPFPSGRSLEITIICSPASEVLGDFEGALQDARGRVQLTVSRAVMSHPGEIVAAVEGAQGDVLVVCRGGGTVEQLGVFDSREVIEAIAGKSMYRISAIGHAGDHHWIDVAADYAAPTPTAAGNYIREMCQLDLAREQEQRSAIVRARAEGAEETRLRLAASLRQQPPAVRAEPAAAPVQEVAPTPATRPAASTPSKVPARRSERVWTLVIIGVVLCWVVALAAWWLSSTAGKAWRESWLPALPLVSLPASASSSQPASVPAVTASQAHQSHQPARKKPPPSTRQQSSGGERERVGELGIVFANLAPLSESLSAREAKPR